MHLVQIATLRHSYANVVCMSVTLRNRAHAVALVMAEISCKSFPTASITRVNILKYFAQGLRHCKVQDENVL